MNTYGYVGGNPLSYVDPYGLKGGGARTSNNNRSGGTGPYGGSFGNPLNLQVMRNDYVHRNHSVPNPQSPIKPSSTHNPNILRDYVNQLPSNNVRGDKTGPQDMLEYYRKVLPYDEFFKDLRTKLLKRIKNTCPVPSYK